MLFLFCKIKVMINYQKINIRKQLLCLQFNVM